MSIALWQNGRRSKRDRASTRHRILFFRGAFSFIRRLGVGTTNPAASTGAYCVCRNSVGELHQYCA